MASSDKIALAVARKYQAAAVDITPDQAPEKCLNSQRIFPVVGSTARTAVPGSYTDSMKKKPVLAADEPRMAVTATRRS